MFKAVATDQRQAMTEFCVYAAHVILKTRRRLRLCVQWTASPAVTVERMYGGLRDHVKGKDYDSILELLLSMKPAGDESR